MKVCHLNAIDWGGATRAAIRLHRGLNQIGVDSSFVIDRSRGKKDDDVTFFPADRSISSRLSRKLRRRVISSSRKKYETTPSAISSFRDDRSHHGKRMLSTLPECDILNLHWVAEYVDFSQALPGMTRKCPVVWTLHDMNAFTGGCHFTDGCERYMTGCGSCPQLGSSDSADLSSQAWNRKLKAVEEINPERLTIACPSHWMADCVRNDSLLARFPVEVIPYGIDTEIFKPRDMAVARDIFGLSEDDKVILFVSEYVNDPRKGISYLADALSRFTDESIVILTVGNGELPNTCRHRSIELGSINDDRLLSLAYGAADLFVCPSLQDNLPNTVIEALACGTPVVGFDIGGLPDMIQDGVNGFTAKLISNESLHKAMHDVVNAPDLEKSEMRGKSRKIAVERYALNVQAERYQSLYAKLIAS